MEEVFQYLKTFRSQVNVKNETRRVKEDTDSMAKVKGQICFQILEKQRKFALMESDSSTLNQTLKLMQQEKLSLSTKLVEKSACYKDVAEGMIKQLQEQQEWAKSQSSSQIPKGLISQKARGTEELQEDKKSESLKRDIQAATAKLDQKSQSRSNLVLENTKLKESIEQVKTGIVNFKPELRDMDEKSLNDELQALLSDKDGETEHVQSLQLQITKLKRKRMATNQKLSKKNLNITESESDIDEFNHCDTVYKINEPDVAFAQHSQRMLEIGRRLYRGRRYHGPEDELKTCIWSGGDSFSWNEKSSGISWIGVNGTERVCVLSSSKQDVLLWRPYGRHQMTLRGIHANAVSDMGVWADISSTGSTKFRRQISKSEGPFAVVSVAPDSVVEDKYLHISDKCQEQATRAIKFLESKLKNRSSLSSSETIEIAVCALKYLLGPKFNANEIEAFGSGKYGAPMSPSKSIILRTAKDLGVGFPVDGQEEVGVKLMENAKDILDATLGPNHVSSLETSLTHSATYVSMGRYTRAIDVQEKAVEDLKGLGSSVQEEFTDEEFKLLSEMKAEAAESHTRDLPQIKDSEVLCEMISKCGISDYRKEIK